MTETREEQCERCWKEGRDFLSELANDPDNNLFSNGLNIGRKIKAVEDRVAEKSSDEIDALKARIAVLEEALDRQGDNMAFVLNHVTLPPAYYDKFTRELESDRKALEDRHD